MLYNIKMRSSKGGPHEKGGKHISGAERILREDEIEDEIIRMYQRALNHEKGSVDFINIKIQKVNEEDIVYIPQLSIKEFDVKSKEEGLELAKELLKESDVEEIAIENGIESLLKLQDSMHGAILIDKDNGNRLDDRASRGVRATGMGFADNFEYDKIDKINPANDVNEEDIPGIHFNEALVLASKVTSCKGIIAELCWSDDPNYLTGYISNETTYNRISIMKDKGNTIGGRIFFVDTNLLDDNYTLDDLIDYLEKQVVLIE